MEPRTLETRHGTVRLPAFLPDATRGTVRAVPTHLLGEVGVEVLMCNALHLAERPGADAVRRVGGLHAFMGFRGPIVTDSGGFQVWSLSRDRGGAGTVTDKGFVVPGPDGRGKRMFGPDRAMATQLKLGADIVFCLDQCTHPDDPPDVQDDSVRRTLRWAAACRRLVDRRPDPPLLFAVVQGGRDAGRRRRCVEGLLEIGFDGYGFGGFPVGDDGRLVDEVGLVAELLPAGAPRHALGIGRPDSVLQAWRLGWRTFDSVAPTREARRGLLYVPSVDLSDPAAVLGAERISTYLDGKSDKSWRDPRPVDETCPCPLCRGYSRAYLAHLLRVEDPAGATLATLHNLAFLNRLIATLRRAEESE